MRHAGMLGKRRVGRRAGKGFQAWQGETHWGRKGLLWRGRMGCELKIGGTGGHGITEFTTQTLKSPGPRT